MGCTDLWCNKGEIVCKGSHGEPDSRELLQGGGSRTLVNAVNWPGKKLVRG